MTSSAPAGRVERVTSTSVRGTIPVMRSDRVLRPALGITLKRDEPGDDKKLVVGYVVSTVLSAPEAGAVR